MKTSLLALALAAVQAPDAGAAGGAPPKPRAEVPPGLRIQIGYEHFKDGRRDLRLTPIDEAIPGIPPAAMDLLEVLIGMLDLSDVQPGDGEFDFAIQGKMGDLVRSRIPAIGRFLPTDGANGFFRIRRA